VDRRSGRVNRRARCPCWSSSSSIIGGPWARSAAAFVGALLVGLSAPTTSALPGRHQAGARLPNILLIGADPAVGRPQGLYPRGQEVAMLGWARSSPNEPAAQPLARGSCWWRSVVGLARFAPFLFPGAKFAETSRPKICVFIVAGRPSFDLLLGYHRLSCRSPPHHVLPASAALLAWPIRGSPASAPTGYRG